jgi:hypothetical protein
VQLQQIAVTIEPRRVRLLEDFLDTKAGVGFPKGTELIRLPGSSQYAPEGTQLGQDCATGFFLIKDICEILEV